MKTQYETQDICAEILRELREHMGISKAKMADRMDLDARTYTRYEAGESAPTLPEFIRMLEAADAPALPVVLRHIYPESFGKLGPGSDSDATRQALADFILRDAPDRIVRQLAYFLFGPHGSTLEGQLQLITALDHLPMDARLASAKLVLNFWEIETARGKIINPEYVMPDTETFRQCIIRAHEAVVAGRQHYNSLTKKDPP